MIVYVETPAERRERIAKRAKRKAAKKRKGPPLVLKGGIRSPRKARFENEPVGGDWWNDLEGDEPC